MADAPTDSIKERVDIVALISESLPLKRAGSNLKARCPFHEEDTPSFMVSPSRQTFRCFGCGEGGDIFSWLMKREGMSFPEALRVLAQRAGVPLTFTRSGHGEERERLRATLDLAATFYHRILFETAHGTAIRAYLEEREISPETMTAWRLGFCPSSPTHITEKAEERGVTEDELVRAGILGSKTGRVYEFFSGRILFPLTDAHGSVVGLAGRVFLDDWPGAPKYMNSPETVLYKKSAVLYGLDRGKDAIRKENVAVLVEGYTDVILSHQAGATHVVATAGTALTDDHLRLLRRFTDALAFAFDADAGGEGATRRAITLALDAGFLVSIVVLPSGSDPADLIRADPEQWRRALADRRDVFSFLLEQARTRNDIKTPEGQKAAAADLLPVIARVRDPIIQGQYVQEFAESLGVDARYVHDALAGLRRETATAPRPSGTGTTETRMERLTRSRDANVRREERLLVLLLADLSLVEKAAGVFPAAIFAAPHVRALYTALIEWYGSDRAARPGSPEDSRSESVGGPRPSVGSLADFRAALPDDLRQRLDALLFELDVEREREGWEPGREAGELLRTLLQGHFREELRSRTKELQEASAAERPTRLRAIADLTGKLAQAGQMTWDG